MKRVDIVGLQLDAASGANLVVLREQDEPHRLLPIVVGGVEAASIAFAVSGQQPPRPLTHDLMAALVANLAAQVNAIEVTALRDGIFLAELAIEGPTGDLRLDSRPSDAIALAVRLGTPMFVSDAVLDEAGTLVREELDEATIEAQVTAFRSQLDQLDPTKIAEVFNDAGGEDQDEYGEKP